MRFVLALVMACIGGCDTTEVMCDCAMGGTSVIVPEALTAMAFALSGACDVSDLSCSDGGEVATCATRTYFIEASRAGTCHLEVDLQGASSFIRDLHFEHSDGCCEGFYPVSGDDVVTVEAS